MSVLRALLLLLIVVAASPAHAQSEDVGDIFREWLETFNSGDLAAIRAFYGKRLGDPAAVMALENAEDTCGFDLVRVEAQTTQSMSVVLAEKCFPALQRLKMEIGIPGEAKLKIFELTSFVLDQRMAISAIVNMADRLAARDKFAGSLVIVRGHEQAVARSWGLVDKAGSAPITLDTPMFLASSGKMFTAVSVLQLADAGKIDLDAPIGRYLIDYPNRAMAAVTIRQLLQHRGGAGDIGILGKNDGANRTRVRTIDDIVVLNGDRPPAFTPGSKAEYSNYGFVLLGAVVERVTGTSYYDYVADNIFKPARMSDAGYPTLDHLQGVSAGYTTYYGGKTDLVSNRKTLPWRGSPAGGGVASANDMLKFFQALKSGKLLSPQMFELAIKADATPWYGMGFVVNPSFFPSWGHGGNSYGMDVAAHFYPKIDTTFVCLASRDMVCNRLIQAWFRRTLGRTQ